MKKLVRQRLVRILILPCLLLIVQGFALGQVNNPNAVTRSNSRISGHVFDANRRPLSDVYVELRDDVESVVQRTKTSSGAYTFNNLSGGRFSVRVRPFGTDYEEQIADVEIVTSVNGRGGITDVQYKDFYLKTKRETNTTPAVTEVIFAQEIPEDAKHFYYKALNDLQASHVDVGVSELESAVKAFPDYFQALDRLGVELLKQQRFADAAAYFQRAVAINQKSSNSWYGLAFARYTQKQTPGSIEAAQKAADLAPDSADISLMLGIAQRQGKNYADAERAMLKAKKLSNGLLADAMWNLALLYVYNIKDSKRAADELESYLKVKPEHPDAEKIRRLISQLRLA